MFGLKKSLQEDTRSPKQIYEERLEQMRVEAVENGEYTYKIIEPNSFPTILNSFPTIKILSGRFNNNLLGDFEIKEGCEHTGYKLLIASKYDEVERQKQRAKEIELQRQEDEEYSEKLRKLLEIKPLDADLKRSLKKTERLLEIAEEYKSLEKEMFELRK